MEEIIVREIVLPYGVKGTTIKDENDDYNVYINAIIGDQAKEKALKHELEHIRKKHFYAIDKSVKEIEQDITA